MMSPTIQIETVRCAAAGNMEASSKVNSRSSLFIVFVEPSVVADCYPFVLVVEQIFCLFRIIVKLYCHQATVDVCTLSHEHFHGRAVVRTCLDDCTGSVDGKRDENLVVGVLCVNIKFSGPGSQ